MTQITLRLPDDVVRDLKSAAAARGRSLNAWATEILSASVDPEHAGSEREKLRERLARAGLLAEVEPRLAPRPRKKDVNRARAMAGRGTSLADLVREGRR